MKNKKVTAKEVIEALRKKHAEDVFVDECNAGSAWFGAGLRLDAWAMKKSWKNPLTIGYEIKVARADFMQDQKYPCYKAFCNRLYLVCPWGLVEPDEVAEGVGLMYLTKTGASIRTIKQAQDRDSFDPDIMKYILFSRAQITRDRPKTQEEKVEAWRKFVDQEKEFQSIGHLVSARLQVIYKRDVEAVRSENEALQHENETLAEIKEYLKEIGIEPRHGWQWKTAILSQLREFVLAEQRSIESVITTTNELTAKLEALKNNLRDKEKIA